MQDGQTILRMRSGQIPHYRTTRTASKSNGQHPYHRMGQRHMAVVGGDARGCPLVRSPPDNPKATGEPMGRSMEETQAAREVDCPSETVVVVNLDKMPPLEEDEAIVELDAAIDEAGDEGEEGPKPLDEVNIREAA